MTIPVKSSLLSPVIRLQPQDDVTSSVFIGAMERGLASAYYVAFQRQGAGGLSPARRRRFAALPGAVRPPRLEPRVERGR